MKGARAVLIRLLHKAAARLLCINYWAGRMDVYISYTFREEGWSGSIALGMCQDTLSMLQAFEALWQWRPRYDRPTQVAITLYELTPNGSATLPLFNAEQRRIVLSRTIDRLNHRFGPDAVYFGGMHGMTKTAPTRISFNQIPDFEM